ncbi:transposase [Treponema endosymbiont of Eucomonympha sp.]|uniref:transposase n=1 Tax=Treponema endosymbiont of Eucomonympha sp. TaxID=1580831 RepID=UPI00075145E1|nr:transposase [Treponema endosymbiont of Eucomonympha sp.]
MVVDEYGIPASGIVTSGTVAACNQAPLLMEDLEAEAFLADKAYDTNELLDMLKEADITAVIPPVKSRKEQRAYSHELYRARHVVENVFCALKSRRVFAPRRIAQQTSGQGAKKRAAFRSFLTSPPFVACTCSSTFQSALPRLSRAFPL